MCPHGAIHAPLLGTLWRSGITRKFRLIWLQPTHIQALVSDNYVTKFFVEVQRQRLLPFHLINIGANFPNISILQNALRFEVPSMEAGEANGLSYINLIKSPKQFITSVNILDEMSRAQG